MRVPVYIMCAALVVAVNSEENYYDRRSDPTSLSEDQETLGYLLPRLMAKYKTNRQWLAASPYYSPYHDIDSNDIDSQIDNVDADGRSKRHDNKLMSPSLSITNSLDVLRNRLLLEISRKKAMMGMKSNRNLLCKIGKRTPFNSKRNCDDESEKYIDDKLMI